MSFVADLKTLYHLTLSPVKGGTHAERLDHFYSKQAEGYDAFRKRLLQGREELCRRLPIEDGAVWADLGGGTGANLEALGEGMRRLKQVYVVDLSPSLLKVAKQRAETHGWTNVAPVCADVTTFLPDGGAADVVLCSYSLTMIPDWFAAIDQAWRMLRPGGLLGVVDFYLARKFPDAGRARHSWLQRTLWPAWFAADNVYPCADHVPYLHQKFTPVHFSEHQARLPYIPWPRMPYYQFVGRKDA